jgi:hypothetical protein
MTETVPSSEPRALRVHALAAAGLAALLSACAPKDGGQAAAATGAAPAAAAVPAPAPVRSGPANAPVARAGQPHAVPLDAAQRRELHAAVAKVPAAFRPRLRYALASGDDGKPHLVVYDGQGLGVDGRPPGKPHAYVVFQVLNAANGEHYDPLQNSLIAAIPPPPERASAVTP